MELSTRSSFLILVLFWCRLHGAVLFTLWFALILKLTKTRMLSGLSPLGEPQWWWSDLTEAGSGDKPGPGGGSAAVPAQDQPHLSLCLPRSIELDTPPMRNVPFCCSILQMGQNRPHLAQIGKRLTQEVMWQTQDENFAFSESLLSSLSISPSCLKSPSHHGASFSFIHLVS